MPRFRKVSESTPQVFIFVSIFSDISWNLFMEFQRLHKVQRIQSKPQSKTREDNQDVPEKELKKLTVDTLAEDKKSDYFRPIREATSYRDHILELIDNIEDMIVSLNHCSDFEKEDMLMEIKTENETLKGLLQE